MTHDETQHETPTHHANPFPGNAGEPQPSQLGESLIGLERLGRLWATHGIRMGVAALQTSAVTLTQVASTLATLADGLKVHEAPSPEDEHHEG